ncbi:MAG: hypothetical protein RI897_1084, partial [Verrucomicrobiota bacterium]
MQQIIPFMYGCVHADIPTNRGRLPLNRMNNPHMNKPTPCTNFCHSCKAAFT